MGKLCTGGTVFLPLGVFHASDLLIPTSLRRSLALTNNTLLLLLNQGTTPATAAKEKVLRAATL